MRLSRRQFSQEFKLAAIRRLEQGVSIAEVARALEVNPNVLHWVQSGTLMIMVILGGIGHLWGGVLGAMVLLGLEHLIADYPIGWLASLAPNYQQHANLGVGLVMLAIVLFAPQGIAGLLQRGKRAAT